MKLEKFIQQTQVFLDELVKSKNNYMDLYGIEPHVSSICAEDGLILCSGLKRDGCCTTSKKPYKKYPKFKKYMGRIKYGAYGL